MLDDKGRPFAKVTHEAKPIGERGSRCRSWSTRDPKVKIKDHHLRRQPRVHRRHAATPHKKVKAAGFWN
jgi:hypothetical protein